MFGAFQFAGFRLTVLVLTLVALSGPRALSQSGSSPAPASAGIRFHQGDWASLLAEAKKQKKPFFVDFYAVWCGPCKYMTKVTFAEANVGRYANANLLAYKVDAEQGEGVRLAQKYRIDGYPTYVFFSPDGEVLGAEVGAMEAPDFLRLMQGYVEKARRRADGPKGMRSATPEQKSSLGVLFQKQ